MILASRHKIVGTVVLALFALAIAFVYSHYSNTIYSADRANALFSRAETAGFAPEMIEYVSTGRMLIPNEGNPVWWFPTDRTDFLKIQRDIDSIIERGRILRNLPTDSAAYQQGMDDLRGKLRTLQLQVGEAAPYLFVTPLNILLSMGWLALQSALLTAALGGLKSNSPERSRPTRNQGIS